jgi:hypothetical protein
LLQVIESLEKRDDWEVTHKTILSPTRQTGLSREEINSKQVRKTARHADDQGSDAIESVFGNVVAQDTVAGKNIIRLMACWCSRAQERARRAEFFFQERQTPILAPLGELVILRASRLEEPINRQIMKAAVLTDIQIRQVETESIEGAANGIHGEVGKPSSAAGVECFGEQFQVGLKLGRLLKTNTSLQNFCVFDFPG